MLSDHSAHLFCQSEEWRGPADTQHPFHPLLTNTDTHQQPLKQTLTQATKGKQTTPAYKDTHAERPTRLAVDGQWTWAWGLLA